MPNYGGTISISNRTPREEREAHVEQVILSSLRNSGFRNVRLDDHRLTVESSQAAFGRMFVYTWRFYPHPAQHDEAALRDAMQYQTAQQQQQQPRLGWYGDWGASIQRGYTTVFNTGTPPQNVTYSLSSDATTYSLSSDATRWTTEYMTEAQMSPYTVEAIAESLQEIASTPPKTLKTIPLNERE